MSLRELHLYFGNFGARSRLKLVLCLLLVGGFVHVFLSEYPDVYQNIGSYWNEYEDPLSIVLKNSATRGPPSRNRSMTSLESETSTQLAVRSTTQDAWSNKTWSFSRQEPGLVGCSPTPPNLVGPIRVWQDEPSFESLEKIYSSLERGGHGQPENCTARHRVGIVVPFRDRESHLRILLHNLHSFLTKQELDYAIIVVEQVANQTFNRAKLMNVGFVEALKMYPWECFIFHDVDLLPEDDRNLYTCPTDPRHMSVAIDKFDYKLPYGAIFGGISALTVAQMRAINGLSNDFWGWGGEDDDLSTRVSLAGFNIARYPPTIARYKMIKHTKEKSNPVNKCRFKLMGKTKSRWRRDGLNSLNYKVLKTEFLPLFTRLTVDLMEKDSRRVLRREFPC